MKEQITGNKKAFTLVELVAVIVILGLIALIIYPTVMNILSDNKDKLYAQQINNIEHVAGQWIAANSATLGYVNGEEYVLTFEQLQKEGYLKEKDIINPKDNTNIEGCIKIAWNDSENKYKYEHTTNCELTIVFDVVTNFDFIANNAEYIVPKTGTYKLEVWGAQGGGSYGAKGGYSVGTITLTRKQKLYIYVGGKGDSGVNQTVSSLTTLYGGYNGGGNGYMTATATSSYNSLQGGGGGATDIRLNNQTLSARVIVAGGGGGSGYAAAYSLGYGGGTSGGNGYTSNTTNYTYGIGGSQTGGGGISGTSSPTYSITEASSGTLGKGGNGGIGTTAVRSGSGGGGGYYGGGGGGAGASANTRGGGGGSGYIDGVTNGTTTLGSGTFKDPNGINETGHANNGYARITYIGE